MPVYVLHSKATDVDVCRVIADSPEDAIERVVQAAPPFPRSYEKAPYEKVESFIRNNWEARLWEEPMVANQSAVASETSTA